MTERLFYNDSSVMEFEAEITASGQDGDRYYTVLNRTAFYPTSGGQLHDTGKLGETGIVDVIEHESDDIRHISNEPVGEVGRSVIGRIDADRRRRHMQQHTAQHILSQVLYKLYNLTTMSVHLGEEYGAIELDTEQLSPEQLVEVEKAAANMILQNLPIEILFMDSTEAASLPFRKPPKRSGKIRVIRIGDNEYSACGGTHCRSTAEVGLVKLVGTVKIRGRLMVRFLSGVQALADYDMRFAVTDKLSQAMTCHVNDLPEKFEKLESDNKALAREISRIQKEILPSKAQALAEGARSIGTTKMVMAELSDIDNKLAAQLGSMTADIIEGLAVLYLDGRLIISTSGKCGVDAGKLARDLAQKAGLKGGGNPSQAHLGNASIEKLDDYRKMIAELIG